MYARVCLDHARWYGAPILLLVSGNLTSTGYAYEKFSIQAVIAAPFFYLIGGNVNVFNANALAIIADISSDITERYEVIQIQHAPRPC